jgi:multidrug efflux system outer membrane protein
VANFFPKLNLTGLLGQTSPELAAFTSGGAMAWAIAADLTGPLFHAGELRARYREALAAREQSGLQYQKTVLVAFQDVSNSLISRQKYGEEEVRRRSAVEAYEEAVKTSQERFRVGKSSYYEVLQEQLLLFPAQNSLVDARFNHLLGTVQLYRALGGGW